MTREVLSCALCGASGARWTQFRHGHCAACDRCARRLGGWREEEASAARPLASMLPRARRGSTASKRRS